MKILHINSYYSVSNFYKNLYDKQKEKGLDIAVYIPVSSIDNNTGFNYGKYSTISKSHNKYDRYLFHLKHCKIYKDVKKNYNIEKYSVTHAHSLFSNGYIAMRLKKEYGIPYIVAVRNTDVNIFFKKMIHLRKLGIKILEEANQIIFLSKPYRDLVIKKYVPEDLKEMILGKVTIIPNGIDDFWFNNIGKPKQIQKIKDIKLLHIGNISKNKNISTTVKAIEILIRKGYKVKLDVVGKIIDQNIFDEIKEMEYVNYIGYEPKEELIKIYKENDIFVLASITETFGLVYGEAMSQGLPVVYTKNQGFDEQFENGEVGFAVDCFDIDEIAEKIVNITNDYKAISKRCIIGSKKFDWAMIEKSYRELYIK